jgi:hypothetical protein
MNAVDPMHVVSQSKDDAQASAESLVYQFISRGDMTGLKKVINGDKAIVNKKYNDEVDMVDDIKDIGTHSLIHLLTHSPTHSPTYSLT